MIKYFVILSSIFITFVTGEQQREENVANIQGVPTYVPSDIELQFPMEARVNKIAPNVVGENTQKIPCPIFHQRRLEDPNIPAEQPWLTVNKGNSVPVALRRSHTEDPISRRSNAENFVTRKSNTMDPGSQNSDKEIQESLVVIADDPTSRRYNIQDPKSRRSHTEEPSSRRLIADDPASRKSNQDMQESWKFTADEPISRRSNMEDPKSRRSHAEEPSSRRLTADDPASRKSNKEMQESWRFIADDPISRRSNTEDPKSRRSHAEEPSSRRLTADDPASRKMNQEMQEPWKFPADDPISRRSNTEDPKSRRSHAEEPSSRKHTADDPASRKSNEEMQESWRSIADDPISRRSNTENPKSRRSHVEEPSSRIHTADDPASRKSNKEMQESWRFIADDPVSRRSNTEDPNSRRSYAEEPSSRRLIADDPTSRRYNEENQIVANPISRRSNSVDFVARNTNEEISESFIYTADGPILRRSNAESARNFYAGVPTSRRFGEQFPGSRRYPWQTIDTLRQTPDDGERQSLVLPLSNDRRTQPYTNAMQTQLRRDNFNGLPPSPPQPQYNAWQVLNNGLNVPSPNGDIQVQPLINYPAEITSPNPSKTINPSDCNIKTKLSNVNEPLTQTRRDEVTPRRIVPGSLNPNQITTPRSVDNQPENNQQNLTTISIEKSTYNEEVADAEKNGRTNVLQESNDESVDRMSIADIEQQLMEPAKGAGIIKITDAHLSVMDSSRVCYACSSITDPTCWNPERKTTVKYCARGRDSCVTKTYKGKDSLVVIRDCSTACDDALPVLGKKYESCSICGNDLCNNLSVEANGASSIYTRKTIGIMIFSWFIKHYLPYRVSY